MSKPIELMTKGELTVEIIKLIGSGLKEVLSIDAEEILNIEAKGVYALITYEDEGDNGIEWVTIEDFGFLMPLLLEWHIYYTYFDGGDYSNSFYKAYHQQTDGCHNHATSQGDMTDTAAICLIRTMRGYEND